MSNTADLDCKIYVDATVSRKELTEHIAHLLSGTLKGNTICTEYNEIDVWDNEDFDEKRRKEFPDGFLYFSHYIEVYIISEQSLANRVALVTKILDYLWSGGMAAVAACDYEKELPNNGGYKSRATPWVRKND